MFVGQRVFYTNNGSTRLGRVKSFKADEFETENNSSIPQSVAIGTLEARDCILYRHDVRPIDTFLAPGVCVGQTETSLVIRRPAGAIISTHSRPQLLHHMCIDMWGKRFFGLDAHGRFFLYIFGIDEPSRHDHFVNINPIGWLHVPTTMTFLCWNSSLLYMVDVDNDRELKLPQKNVQCAATSHDGGLCVTGDISGQVCVWYTSAWQCHHSLQLFVCAVEECTVSSSGHAAARTTEEIVIFDTTTGVSAKRIKRPVDACCYVGVYLAVSTGESIELYVDGLLTIAFKYECNGLYTSRVEERVWSVHGATATELRLAPESNAITWARDCADWIRTPSLPFDESWPSPRYMDVLAAAASEWYTRLTSFEFPRDWMRHGGLRNAIWDACLEHMPEEINRVSEKWHFLETHVLKLFVVKCVKYIETRMSSFEWDDYAVAVLEYVYRRTAIKSDIVKRWCWFHHGRPRIQAVLLRLFEKDHDHSLMAIAAADTVSPDAILCLTQKSLSIGLRAGYTDLYIRWLESFHRTYARAPTQRLCHFFAMIFEHVFTKMSTNNLDVPLPHSGNWRCLAPTPGSAGTYVRDVVTRATGFVQKVVVNQSAGRRIHWYPNRRPRAHAVVSTSDELEFWTWNHPSPRTLFECALYLMRKETLSHKGSTRKWSWFKSKVGAVLSIGRRIIVFDKTMRIKSAVYEQGTCTLRTSTNMNIDSSENVSIEIDEPSWSYMDTYRHRVLPMECKIVRLLNSITRACVIDKAFASDLLSCCRSKMLDIEHVWFPKSEIHATLTQEAAFFAGFGDGTILEFENISLFENTLPIRTYSAHEDAILELHAVGEKMISLSRNMMGMWCLLTGMLLHRYESLLGLHALVVVDARRAWVVENDVAPGTCPIVTLWDIEFEQALEALELTTTHSRVPTKYWIAHCGSQFVLVFDNYAIVWSGREVDHVCVLDVIGDITCVSNTDTHVVGGTTKGALFIFDIESDAVEQWSAADKAALVCMTSVPDTDFIVTGSSAGQISVWDAVKRNFGVCLYISDTPITYLSAHGNLVLAITDTAVHVMSVVPYKCADTCVLLHKLMQWSWAWKNAVMRKTVDIVQPCIVSCLLGHRQVEHALSIVEQCTVEYNDRAVWCKERLIGLLLEVASDRSRRIIRKIAAYRGHRIDCVICNDCDSKDTVSYIALCQHRFHTGCLNKLVKKTPELHQEMQYEYALSVPLKCPTCRVEFEPSDVKLDHFLNHHIEH